MSLYRCSTIIRSGCGSENASLAACHMLLWHGHTDSFSKEKSYSLHHISTSTEILLHVQRNESWWAQLRKSVSNYWINLFKVTGIDHDILCL